MCRVWLIVGFSGIYVGLVVFVCFYGVNILITVSYVICRCYIGRGCIGIVSWFLVVGVISVGLGRRVSFGE